MCREAVPDNYCGNCNVVDGVDYVTGIGVPVDYSLENIPTRCADYHLAGGDTDFEYDSDRDMYMGLRDSSTDEDEEVGGEVRQESYAQNTEEAHQNGAKTEGS